MLLSVEDLFKQIELNTEGREYKLSIRFLEIYNEVIKDLLQTSGDHEELREDPIKGVCVTGEPMMISSAEEIMSVLFEGNKWRTTESTAANEVSSRSHAVLTIYVESKQHESKEVSSAKLNFIDLAGSEWAAAT